MRFAIERRQIGRQCIGEQLPLSTVGVGLQEAQVSREFLQPEFPQASRQAAVHHLALLRAQRYSGTFMNERSYPRKIMVGQEKIRTHRGWLNSAQSCIHGL